MNSAQLFWLAPIGSLLALVYAYYFYASMMKANPGSEKSQEVANNEKAEVKSYLLSQYKVTGLFFIIAFAFFVFLAFVLEVMSPWTPIAFLTGGFFSALSSYLGLKSATSTSNRAVAAANDSLNSALRLTFRSASVTGFVVAALSLLDICIWWKILTLVYANKQLFADSIFAIHSYSEITTIMLTFCMGASFQALFAKVGSKKDKGGELAGISADLYESYTGSILATTALGAFAFSSSQLSNLQLNSILLPIAIAAVGIVFSIFGSYSINTQEEATHKDLMKSVNRGVNFTAFFIAMASIVLVNSLLPQHFKIYGSIISGLVAGIIISWATNYYSSESKEEGIPNAMAASAIPVVTLCFAILFSYGFAGGFTNPAMGFYGIGIAAVGMLSTLGITLATGAYGSIAASVSQNAQSCEMSAEVRKRTDELESLGRTTLASTRGFTIGSASLTTLALLGAYIEEIRIALIRLSATGSEVLNKFIFPTSEKAVTLETATVQDFVGYYNVNLLNPTLLVGILLGAMLVLVFSSLTMKTLDRDSRSFVKISALVVVTPVIIGLVLGVAGVMGMLVGSLGAGFVLAITMSNAGEPFKDSIGSSINSLIKIMTMVSIVIAGLTVNYSATIQNIMGLNPTEITYKAEYAKLKGISELGGATTNLDGYSSIYEDPLLGTEDIILPTDDDMFRVRVEDTKPETKPQSQKAVESVKSVEKPAESANGFDSGFGGGFDSFDTPAAPAKEAETTKATTESGFDSGFGGGFDTPAAPAKEAETTKTTTESGFDSGFGGGFDSFDAPVAPAKEAEPTKTATATATETETTAVSGFDSAFDAGFETPKTEEPAKPTETTKSAETTGFDAF